MDNTFNRMLDQRAKGVVYGAATDKGHLVMGFGPTYKSARANAVAYASAYHASQPLAYTFTNE